MTVSNGRNTDKSDLGYRIGYSPNGTDNELATNECGWLTSHIFSNAPKLSLCKHYTPQIERALVTWVSPSKRINIGWSCRYSCSQQSLSDPLTFCEFSTLIKCSFVFHQERLLHRNSNFLATEDSRGITQRSKRSPGKQPETGTPLLLSSLFSSHLRQTEVVC